MIPPILGYTLTAIFVWVSLWLTWWVLGPVGLVMLLTIYSILLLWVLM